MISRQYNSVYGASWRDLIYRQWVVFLLFLVVAVLLRWVMRRQLQRPSFDDLFVPLVLLSVASLAYYFQQHKSWPYQVIPFQMFAALGVAIALGGVWDHASRVIDRSGNRGLRIAAGVIVIALLLAAMVDRVEGVAVRAAASRPDAFARIVTNYSRPGDRVLFIETSVMPAYPLLVELNRAPGSRYLWMFPIALFEAHRRPQDYYKTYAALSHDERRFVDEVEQDILTLKPRLIFVVWPAQGCPWGFDLNRYIRSTGILPTAMASYTPVTTSGIRFYVLSARNTRGAVSRPNVDGMSGALGTHETGRATAKRPHRS